VVLRSLFETTARFAWIAVEPTTRMPRWLKWDRDHRLNAQQALADVGDPIHMPDDALAVFKRESDAADRGMPNLKVITAEADSHWSHVIESHGTPSSRFGLAGLYRVLYAHTSAVGHGNAIALQNFVTSGGPHIRVVVAGELIGDDQPYGLASIVFSMALLVFERAFSSPGITEALDALFTRFPDTR
jgi:hypothetical protein